MFLYVPEEILINEYSYTELDVVRPQLQWASIDVFRKKMVEMVDEKQQSLSISSLYDLPENKKYFISGAYHCISTKNTIQFTYEIQRFFDKISLLDTSSNRSQLLSLQTKPTEHYVFHTSTVISPSDIEGMIYITNERLIFVPKFLQLPNFIPFSSDSKDVLFLIPLALISQTIQQNSVSVQVIFNSFYHPTLPSSFTFTFSSETFLIKFMDVVSSLRFHDGGETPLNKITPTNENKLLFCGRVDGIYNPNVEMNRQHMEENFMITDSLLFQLEWKKRDLFNIAEFRSKGRIPLVTYYNKENGAALYRSSQPLVATKFGFGVFKSSQCANDQKLIHHFRCDGRDESAILFILDCRAVANVVANRLNGGGTESSVTYKNCIVEHLNLPNIKGVFSAYQKMIQGVNNRNKKPLSNLFNSIGEWLDILQLICNGVVKTVDLLKAGNRVLVHCSDGWDRTPQISSLTRICLDQYNRTLEGFLSLVEFEWIMLGHKFQSRLRNSAKDNSPIFFQFLEIVALLMKKYHNAFEFNEELLLAIAEESVCPTTGTFLYNCERDRYQYGVKESRSSFFVKILDKKEDFINPNANKESTIIITPDFDVFEYGVWKNYYVRQPDFVYKVAEKYC
ncbi:Myotubularin [Entamoeba marina]